MNIDYRKIPLPSYYHSIFNKIDRASIDAQIISKLDKKNAGYSRDDISLFIEFSILFLTIDFVSKLAFDKNQYDDLIIGVWNSTFSRDVNKLSRAEEVDNHDYEITKRIFSDANKLLGIDQLEEILSYEIYISEYRISDYDLVKDLPDSSKQVLYTEKTEGFFKPFINMNSTIKKLR